MAECTYDMFNNPVIDACEIARTCDDAYFNLFVMHHCHIQNLWITIPIVIIIIFICFFLLSDTANKYLSNALTILADKCKMSQNLAAVTFLALGNGAPDVISSIVGGDDEGIEFSLGALLGSTMIVTGIVLSTVILFSDGGLKVAKQLFLRDIGLFLFALILLFIFAISKEIYLWESIIFFCLYLMYIFFNLKKCSNCFHTRLYTKEER
jgi:sodium/potassium/calcium exchanger 6